MYQQNIDSIIDNEVRLILSNCMSNTKFCAKTLFADTFYSPFSELHNKIFKLIDSGARRIAIAAPRGLGKTSIARTVAMKAILFRMSNFIVYLMNSATVAEMQTENIKKELLSNQIIRGLFGSIKDADFEYELDEQFSKLAWTAFGNTLVLPRGQGQQVRGLNWNKHRPQLVICDDLENKDEIQNKDNRVNLKNWFYSDVMKSFNFYKNDWAIIYIDTIKHEDSLLQELMESPLWATIRLSICDDNYNSLDVNYMSTEEIKEEVDEHRRLGTLDVFYMERMNVPTAKENASFKQEHFRYYEETAADKVLDMENVIIVDPAKTTNMKNADSAIVGVGISTKKNSIYVRDVFSDKVYPDDLYSETFSMAFRLNSRVIAVETTSLEEFIKQPFINEASKRNWKGEFIWLKARGGLNDDKGKVERIKALVPYYRQGNVYHNQSCCGKLEQQLLAFPKPKLWDVMDALAYIVEIMEMGGRYFEKIDDGSDEPTEDEYSDIVNDPMINWSRVV